jgi:hypothetical protein
VCMAWLVAMPICAAHLVLVTASGVWTGAASLATRGVCFWAWGGGAGPELCLQIVSGLFANCD